MRASHKIESPGRRAAAYWFVDGLPDIVFGLALLLLGGVQILWRASFAQAAQADIFVTAVGILLFLWKYRQIIESLKSRITYPRTGYVHPPEDADLSSQNRLTTLSLRPAPPADENVTGYRSRTVMLTWWLFYAAAADTSRAHWIVPLKISLFALLFYVLNRKSEHPYSWWSALILGLAGPAIFIADIRGILEPALPLIVPGIWMSAQGVYMLVQYLRANPYPAAPEGAQA